MGVLFCLENLGRLSGPALAIWTSFFDDINIFLKSAGAAAKADVYCIWEGGESY